MASTSINPQILSLHALQLRDRRLTKLERQLEGIPRRIAELDADLARLEGMLHSERKKLDDTRGFQRQQERQLEDEEAQLRASKAKLSQVKNPRELGATQREIETTRRLSSARSDEIQKVMVAVADAEGRIAAMEGALEQLRTEATAEKARLVEEETKLREKIARLRAGRGPLAAKVDKTTLATYDRVRRRLGGVAFVAASQERCTGCKMQIPALTFSLLMRGDHIHACESCGRLLYWQGHFPEEAERVRAAEATRAAHRAPASD